MMKAPGLLAQPLRGVSEEWGVKMKKDQMR